MKTAEGGRKDGRVNDLLPLSLSVHLKPLAFSRKQPSGDYKCTLGVSIALERDKWT